MPEKEIITVFAKTNFRNQEVPFGIKTDDRRRHMYMVGKTGMGKTSLMENMVIQDIRNGHGVAFLDPHGDSVQKILDCVPASRVNDVIYFNPADMEHPIAFNILESVDPKYKHLVASGLMGVFTKIWANLWSARMEYILNNTILALLDSPGNTMLGIPRMYVDKKYRKKIVDNVKDPMVRAFWTDEFANYAEKYRTEAVAPIQNKVGQFLSSGIIRNIVGQPRSTIDLREVMDANKILIMDLSKGKVGEDNSALLGAMLVTKLQLAAMSRTDIPEPERKDFYLYVDEFQNFATESFATILSEARKYRLNLIVGHQYIAQLEQEKSTKVRDAIFGNVGTIILFRIGAADAEFLETEFDPTFTPNDMVNLPKYNIILKLMINGVASEPFSATTLAPNPDYITGNSEKVIKVSRERYSNSVAEVEEKISRWMGAEFHQEQAVLIGAQDRDVDAEMEARPEPQIEQAPLVPMPKAKVMEIIEQPANEIIPQKTEISFNYNPEPEPKPEPVRPVQQAPRSVPQATSRPSTQVKSNFNQDRRLGDRADRRDDRGGRRQDDRRDFRNDNRRLVQPQRYDSSDRPQQPQRPVKKSENPIWNTVATIRREKVERVSKKVGDAVGESFKQPAPIIQQPAQQVSLQPQITSEPPALTGLHRDQSDRKILQPGQSQKF
jgi:hypothetical protein